jgi:hypothetical protein
LRSSSSGGHRCREKGKFGAEARRKSGRRCKGGLNECDKEALKASKSDAGGICVVVLMYMWIKNKD